MLHLIDTLLPGGTERQCVQLVRGLSGAGIESGLWYFGGGPLLREVERDNITLRHLPGGSFLSAQFPFRLIRLATLIRQWRPHVLQTYGFYSNLPGMLAAAIARVPVKVAGRRDLGQHLSPAQTRVHRWAFGLADRIVANSEALRKQLIVEESVEPEKIVVIRNGLKLAALTNPVQFRQDHEPPVVGMVARFREQKDHPTFLLAAKEILCRKPEVRFLLIGSGPLESRMREYAQHVGVGRRVEFMGYLDGEMLLTAIRRFHVAVLSSKNNEGLPNAVLESMAAGLPVVATDVGGCREAIQDGVTGFLVPPGDPERLAESVLWLLRNSDEATRMGKAGRARVEAEFSLSRMVERFQTLYTDLARQKLGRAGEVG